MEFNSVCNHRSNSQNRTTAKRESDLLITGMITDRIGRQEVLLPISHSHYNLGQTPPVGTMSRAKNLEISQFSFQGKWLLLWLLCSILWLVDLAEWT